MCRALAVIASVLLLALELPAEALHLENAISVPAGLLIGYTAVSPAGNVVAALCGDQRVRLWDVSSGKVLQTLDVAEQKLTSLHFSDDGQLLALGGAAGRVTLWQLPSATLKLQFTADFQRRGRASEVRALAISPDRKLVAAASIEEGVEVWDLTAAKQVAKMRAPFSGTSGLAFSPDGNLLATADRDANIRVYEARTGVLRSTASDLLLEAFAIVFSRDGRHILAGGADKTINVIDASSGKVLRSLAKQADALGDLRLSRDGTLLAATYFNAEDPSKPSPLVIWDLATQSPRTRIDEPVVRPTGDEFLSDGRLLIASGSEHELKIWSLR
jgi:WD40 repeat protein